MTPLAIASVGAVTVVGDDAPTTAAAVLSGVQLFDDGDVEGSDGEPLTVGATPLPKSRQEVPRLGDLGLIALRECAAAVPARVPLPVVVCAPDATQLGTEPRALLGALLADASLAIDVPRSRVLAGGRASIGEALACARTWLHETGLRGCYLVGVDSLVGRRRLRRLSRDGLVIDTANSDGFIPAEGAAALLLLPRADKQALALIQDFARVRESTAAPSVGRALAAALTEAHAGADRPRPAALVHDASGPFGWFDELTLARTRPPLAAAPELRTLAPAVSTGEIGAASGPLSLALAALLLGHGHLGGPTLIAFLSERPERTAALLTPARPGPE